MGTDSAGQRDFGSRLAGEVVVVGVDASIGAVHALWHARNIAETRSALLVVVSVQCVPASALEGLAAGFGGLLAVPSADEEGVRPRVATLLSDFQGSWQWLVRRGDPALELAAAAIELDADLIVVGSGDHRRRGVAKRLLDHTTRSVLVCGGR